MNKRAILASIVTTGFFIFSGAVSLLRNNYIELENISETEINDVLSLFLNMFLPQDEMNTILDSVDLVVDYMAKDDSFTEVEKPDIIEIIKQKKVYEVVEELKNQKMLFKKLVEHSKFNLSLLSSNNKSMEVLSQMVDSFNIFIYGKQITVSKASLSAIAYNIVNSVIMIYKHVHNNLSDDSLLLNKNKIKNVIYKVLTNGNFN
ncbi:hypothetical protein A0H76_551 [Hepatospora eriocheir]|uniref:Uncharacterized protein n=1 Tax=Hepatospora eriocheir TaxID=1081669 RepID=A0A1X0Q8I7_9MICR|nr:hypothetical protein A0H76_551 [Hepatospora eriocheir]